MIRFIIKGVLRDRSRSLFPLLIVAAGALLTVFFYSYMQGGKNNFIDTSARYQTGHLKVMTRAYAAESDLLPNDLAITGLAEQLARLRAEYPEILWAPRLRFSGLLDVPDAAGETRAQGPVSGLAIELFSETGRAKGQQEFIAEDRNATPAGSRPEGPSQDEAQYSRNRDDYKPGVLPPSAELHALEPGLTNMTEPQGQDNKSLNTSPVTTKTSPRRRNTGQTADNPSEVEILNLEKGLVAGRLPQKSGEILVPFELARSLNIKPGDRATIISSTMTGALAIADFTVAGVLKFGITQLDRGLLIADLADIQRFLDMEDSAGEIFGFLPNFLYNARTAARIAADFKQKAAAGGAQDDEFQPVMLTLGEQGGLADMIAIYDIYSVALVAVFVAVMSIVLWNAGLMGSLRRYGEIGLRLAMGETRTHLYFSLLGESFIIGVLGSLLGTAFGLAIAYYLQAYGFNAEAFTKSSEMMMTNVIRARITMVSYVIGFIPGLLATLLGTAIAGIGVFRRRTATLMKEFEA